MNVVDTEKFLEEISGKSGKCGFIYPANISGLKSSLDTLLQKSSTYLYQSVQPFRRLVQINIQKDKTKIQRFFMLQYRVNNISHFVLKRCCEFRYLGKIYVIFVAHYFYANRRRCSSGRRRRQAWSSSAGRTRACGLSTIKDAALPIAHRSYLC